MDPRYHGAPGWSNQQGDDRSRRSAQLPTSSQASRGGPPGPPTPPPGYGTPPQYGSGSSSSFSPMHPGGVPAHPSGQYPHVQQPLPGPHQHAQYAPQQYSNSQQYPAWGTQAPGNPGSQQTQPGFMQPPAQQAYPAYGQGAAPGTSTASFMNPWSMISSVSQMGNNMQASQHYVSKKVSWFTGGFFGQLFQIDPEYVRRKLVLLMLPFLGKYDYMRQAENMATPVPTMKPPRDDLFAPDLYIPLHAVFTYVVLSACNRFMSGSFKPDVMYNMFTWASMCWAANFVFMYLLIRMMQLHAPPPALEVLAFAGYSFVGYSVAIPCGWLLGRTLGWYTAWLYTSLCTAWFLIRSLRQVIRVDPSQRGKTQVYLILMMGATQFLVSWVMGATIHSPTAAKKVVDHTLPGT